MKVWSQDFHYCMWVEYLGRCVGKVSVGRGECEDWWGLAGRKGEGVCEKGEVWGGGFVLGKGRARSVRWEGCVCCGESHVYLNLPLKNIHDLYCLGLE